MGIENQLDFIEFSEKRVKVRESSQRHFQRSKTDIFLKNIGFAKYIKVFQYNMLDWDAVLLLSEQNVAEIGIPFSTISSRF